jgi:uncharacterized membrane protein (DUF485 family)
MIGMEWYLPFTIIPGVGLIILSTSNIMLSLNDEISEYNISVMSNSLIKKKLKKLKILSYAIALQYIGLLFFLISGLLVAFTEWLQFEGKCAIFIGVLMISACIILLVIYSFRAVGIRQQYLNDR